MNIIKIIKNNFKSKPYLLRALVFFYNFILLYGKLLVNIVRLRFPVNKRFSLFIKRPRVLQFPVTNKCNLNCKMCGLKNEQKTVELSPQQFAKIFQNTIFKNIRSVGINGGEPFLQKNLFGYIDTTINSFPKLKNIYLISNGTRTSKMLASLPLIKKACSSKKIKLTLSISIDGVDETHDLVRGREGTFATVQKTCSLIKEDQNKYCDDFGVVCTITKHNIYQINELDVWAKIMGFKISYNVATQHVRLNTESLHDDFTVYSTEHTRFMAAEFFYGKFIETKSPFYFALYKVVSESERATGCQFKYDGITILSDGSIAYCATKSKIIGNALIDRADKLFNREKPYRNELIRNSCHKCSHYTGALLLTKYLEYNREILRMIGSPFKFR